MYSLTIPAKQYVMSLVSTFIYAVAMEACLDKRSAYHLRLAVDETVQNIIEHGYDINCTTCGPIQIWAEINPYTVSITIEDTGNAFDMTTHPTPPDLGSTLDTRELGGLGVYLVTKVIDDMRYECVNGHNINRLTIHR